VAVDVDPAAAPGFDWFVVVGLISRYITSLECGRDGWAVVRAGARGCSVAGDALSGLLRLARTSRVSRFFFLIIISHIADRSGGGGWGGELELQLGGAYFGYVIGRGGLTVIVAKRCCFTSRRYCYCAISNNNNILCKHPSLLCVQ